MAFACMELPYLRARAADVLGRWEPRARMIIVTSTNLIQAMRRIRQQAGYTLFATM